MTNGVAPLANAKIDENRRSVDTNENREREKEMGKNAHLFLFINYSASAFYLP